MDLARDDRREQRADARRLAVAYAHGAEIDEDVFRADVGAVRALVWQLLACSCFSLVTCALNLQSDDEDTGRPLYDDLPEEYQLVSDILVDVMYSVDALCTARSQGAIMAEDLARQAKILLQRVQLLPVGFPFTKKGDLELRLGMTLAERRDMLREWEAPRQAEERRLMGIAEEFERSYMRGAWVHVLVQTHVRVVSRIACVGRLCGDRLGGRGSPAARKRTPHGAQRL